MIVLSVAVVLVCGAPVLFDLALFALCMVFVVPAWAICKVQDYFQSSSCATPGPSE
jgi:hypothetical protein